MIHQRRFHGHARDREIALMPMADERPVMEGAKILRAAILGGIPGMAMLWAIYIMLPS